MSSKTVFWKYLVTICVSSLLTGVIVKKMLVKHYRGIIDELKEYCRDLEEEFEFD